ncbi:helix-turn-helix domain-containing protein [Fulvivirga ulvae]|uniref:excisionase family DNA-binding protein n=1 Tax=Fulvivirga ulvae TaxID=2904245 RepID=UPI001F49070A|nr:excisionase family DNA-binding protein [Fulvivirga ulvae]UII29621.1 helix-turn-helix domain-containing protein [Fulvivirga ulvae]
MDALIKRTSQEDQKIARRSLEGVRSASHSIKGSKAKGVKIKIQETGENIIIPKKALALLSAILQNMAEGKSISIIPSDSEISTQQAADMLNISRPHLVKLLEAGAIPFKKVGSHRRILLKDILNYEEGLKTEREKQLDFLAKQAQDLNLGYE